MSFPHKTSNLPGVNNFYLKNENPVDSNLIASSIRKFPDFEKDIDRDEIFKLQFEKEKELFLEDSISGNSVHLTLTGDQKSDYITIRTIFYNYRHVECARRIRACALMRELLLMLRQESKNEKALAVVMYYLETHINRYLEALESHPKSSLWEPSMLEMYLGFYLAHDRLKQDGRAQKEFIDYAMEECALTERDLQKEPDLVRLSKQLQTQILTLSITDDFEKDLKESVIYDDDLNSTIIEKKNSFEFPRDWNRYLIDNYQKCVLDSDLFNKVIGSETVNRYKRRLEELTKDDNNQEYFQFKEPEPKRQRKDCQLLRSTQYPIPESKSDVVCELNENQRKIDELNHIIDGMKEEIEELMKRNEILLSLKLNDDKQVDNNNKNTLSRDQIHTEPSTGSNGTRIVIPKELLASGLSPQELLLALAEQRALDDSQQNKSKPTTITDPGLLGYRKDYGAPQTFNWVGVVGPGKEEVSEPWDDSDESTNELKSKPVPFDEDPMLDRTDEKSGGEFED